MTVDEILSELRLAADPRRVASLRRVGAASPALGVGLPSLRSLAKRIGHDHRLALALWQTPVREARILASLIDEPERVTAKEMDRWAASFDNWEICDQVCQNLFARTPLALAKAVEWTRRSEEFVKRATFVLVAVRAVQSIAVTDATLVTRRRPGRRLQCAERRLPTASGDRRARALWRRVHRCRTPRA
jgi:3-methyladenine DNA glycosylase AlkD